MADKKLFTLAYFKLYKQADELNLFMLLIKLVNASTGMHCRGTKNNPEVRIGPKVLIYML